MQCAGPFTSVGLSEAVTMGRRYGERALTGAAAVLNIVEVGEGGAWTTLPCAL